MFGKQTFRELNYDKRTVKKLFDQYKSPVKTHHPRAINIVTDATYFGERKEDSTWCVAVVRDPLKKENLVWQFAHTETTYLYSCLRAKLENEGYVILSVTADGFPGIYSAFHDIPFQMCHVHMERLVVKGTTKNPQTEAGVVLLALVRTLHRTNKKTFNKRLDMYVEKYRNFLNEKTTNPISSERYWTHKELRAAVMSLIRFRHYLFTYEQNKNIPKTTNSLEGHFSHTKEIVAVHRGLSRPQKEKVLNSIFLASSIAPDKKKLDEIL